jgi:hypothetical protein
MIMCRLDNTKEVIDILLVDDAKKVAKSLDIKVTNDDPEQFIRNLD